MAIGLHSSRARAHHVLSGRRPATTRPRWGGRPVKIGLDRL